VAAMIGVLVVVENMLLVKLFFVSRHDCSVRGKQGKPTSLPVFSAAIGWALARLSVKVG